MVTVSVRAHVIECYDWKVLGSLIRLYSTLLALKVWLARPTLPLLRISWKFVSPSSEHNGDPLLDMPKAVITQRSISVRWHILGAPKKPQGSQRTKDRRSRQSTTPCMQRNDYHRCHHRTSEYTEMITGRRRFATWTVRYHVVGPRTRVTVDSCELPDWTEPTGRLTSRGKQHPQLYAGLHRSQRANTLVTVSAISASRRNVTTAIVHSGAPAIETEVCDPARSTQRY